MSKSIELGTSGADLTIRQPYTSAMAAEDFGEGSRDYNERTKFVSSLDGLRRNPFFQQVVRMGEPAIPLILNEARRKPSTLILALDDITKKDIVGFAATRGSMPEMTKRALRWEEENYFPINSLEERKKITQELRELVKGAVESNPDAKVLKTPMEMGRLLYSYPDEILNPSDLEFSFTTKGHEVKFERTIKSKQTEQGSRDEESLYLRITSPDGGVISLGIGLAEDVSFWVTGARGSSRKAAEIFRTTITDVFYPPQPIDQAA